VDRNRQSKPLLRALVGESLVIPPVWLMRQAGRYLPEYRELRRSVSGFLELCLTPELAAEVTLQPIRRFGMDAAILFSDILVVPHALGQRVDFREGEGPVLRPVRSTDDLQRLQPKEAAERWAPVLETVRQVRNNLPERVALIGFAGAPWTVATYMVEGSSSRDFARTKSWAYADPDSFGRLIALLVETTVEYLSAQVEAGAEALQIFDSWAGVLPEQAFRKWVIEPTQQIVRALKARHPEIPIIGFPRMAGFLYPHYVVDTDVDAVSVDTAVPVSIMRDLLQPLACVQGNLDPLLLVAGGSILDAAVQDIRSALGKGAFVFNLGHGILPETPPEHVARLVELLRHS